MQNVRASGIVIIETKEHRVRQVRKSANRRRRKEHHMLWTIAVVLTVLWLLGLVSSYTMGGFTHILLVIAVVVVLLRIIQGRRVV